MRPPLNRLLLAWTVDNAIDQLPCRGELVSLKTCNSARRDSHATHLTGCPERIEECRVHLVGQLRLSNHIRNLSRRNVPLPELGEDTREGESERGFWGSRFRVVPNHPFTVGSNNRLGKLPDEEAFSGIHFEVSSTRRQKRLGYSSSTF